MEFLSNNLAEIVVLGVVFTLTCIVVIQMIIDERKDE